MEVVAVTVVVAVVVVVVEAVADCNLRNRALTSIKLRGLNPNLFSWFEDGPEQFGIVLWHSLR